MLQGPEGSAAAVGGTVGEADRWRAVACALEARVFALTRAHTVCLGALDAVPFPIVLTDGSAAPMFVHRRAHAVLDLNDGLSLTAAGLTATDCDRSAILRSGIADAINARRRSSMLVPRHSGRMAFVVNISPVDTNPPLDPGVAAVIMIDPEATPEVDAIALRHLYGLTRAESHLVSILVRGRTLEEAAAELFVSLSTVKTHLQRVFLKTDTTRQAQLLRRLMLGHLQFD